MKLYNSKKVFRQGIYELELHPLEPLGVYRLEDVEKLVREPTFDAKPSNMDTMNVILKTNRKHLRNELSETPLDRHCMPDVERAVDEAKRASGRLFLSVKFEFSRDHPSVYMPVIFQRPIIPEQSELRVDRWNPVDEKYFKMTRNARTADVDRARKPNKDILDRLKLILDLPPGLNISESDGDLIWKYRFYLADKFPETSLAKFILSVRWEYTEQVNQAVELLKQWPTIAPEHVLELFTRQFLHPAGRRFAVCRLEAASDEELILYLYQLVQALRYENWHDIFSVHPKRDGLVSECDVSDVKKELISEEAKTTNLKSSNKATLSFSTRRGGALQNIERSCDELIGWHPDLKKEWKEDLASFLIRRAQLNFRIANYLYWFLRLEANSNECEDDFSEKDASNSPDTQKMYKHVLNRLLHAFDAGGPTCQKWNIELLQQTQFIQDLCHLLKSVTSDLGNRSRKIELLRSKLDSEEYAHIRHIEKPFPLPLNPDIIICGVQSSTATLFKSFQRPALLTFIQPNGDTYRAILKHGDDLRQDQLVLQMIELMDVILRKENFDLRLTPYKVLATSSRLGLVQFVESISLADILHRSTLLSYLQLKAPSPTGPMGVQKDVMETYIRSCAGYCVITYLLGVGDRHMENLLLTADGHLFHIDFGFILGSDPKPMAPEVRLTRAMIDGMGGPNSNQFNEFWKITFTAFLILRRHANLFLTLFSLMSNTGIQSFNGHQNNASEFLKEHFCVHQSEERAVSRLANRMTESIKAIVPDIMERIHTIVQYMRN
ncbi:Phosphatidylinositol 3-kinase catalytic subunit type 3 [Schistosoma japonicum]|nr:Phosphatidylinositol 3-kinase catalytic subunit type 3 [Schistosoma japonicum]KAH8861064.1 Phosphatidylinositol 3-kinase catalytic subunit type 3 [Schistosoma japonicum]